MNLIKSKWFINDTITYKSVIDFQNIVKNKFSRTTLPIGSKYACQGSHFLFFNPYYVELNNDGYFSYQTPSVLMNDSKLTYKRRLWSQGEVVFQRPLEYNRTYKCEESIKYCKRIQDTCYVSIKRLISPVNLANSTNPEIEFNIKETRVLAYTNSLPKVNTPSLAVPTSHEEIGRFQLDEIDIFRYSQLTLNPHKIHWDRAYSCKIEKYKNLIAQGPFIVQLMIESYKTSNNQVENIKSINYKNLNHLYPNIATKVLMHVAKPNEVQLFLTDDCKQTIFASLKITI